MARGITAIHENMSDKAFVERIREQHRMALETDEVPWPPVNGHYASRAYEVFHAVPRLLDLAERVGLPKELMHRLNSAEARVRLLKQREKDLREFVETWDALQLAYQDGRDEDVYNLSDGLDRQRKALGDD